MQPHPLTPHGARPIEKASRLLAEGRVTHRPAAHVYHVHGDHAVYRVILDADGIHCDCPARIPLCSHILAAAQVHARENASVRELLYGMPHESEGVAS